MSRAQVASEYLFIMSFAIVLMVGYLATTLVVQQRAIDDDQQVIAQELADQLQQELVLAATFREGYARVIVVPETISGQEVIVTSQPREVIVRVGQHQFSKRTPPFTGTFSVGENTISNVQGVVVS